MENMRPIRMNEHAVLIMPIESVAADVRSLFDDEDSRVEFARQPLGQHAAGETGTDDQIVEARVRADDRSGCGLFAKFVHEGLFQLAGWDSQTDGKRYSRRSCENGAQALAGIGSFDGTSRLR